jgi:hypothetical protein
MVKEDSPGLVRWRLLASGEMANSPSSDLNASASLLLEPFKDEALTISVLPFSSGMGVKLGDHSFSPRPVARSCCCRFQSLNRFLSSNGNPQPHDGHFLSICCSHILCHTTSSSASILHFWLTCAALQSEFVSRKHRILKDISEGRAVRKSIRIRSRTAVERYDSWGKQHCVRMPWSIKFLCFAGAAENSDQTWDMPC